MPERLLLNGWVRSHLRRHVEHPGSAIIRRWAEGRRKAEPRSRTKSAGVTGQLSDTCPACPAVDDQRGHAAEDRSGSCGASVAQDSTRGQTVDRATPPQNIGKPHANPQRGAYRYAEGLYCGPFRDIIVIQPALDLPWTTSPVGGQTNRLKMLKRTIDGRARFQLLRARVPWRHIAKRHNVKCKRT